MSEQRNTSTRIGDTLPMILFAHSKMKTDIGYGMHFPLHAGTEVILTCVKDDVDRPIMLGALHNPELPNLITSSNNSNNMLRSWWDNYEERCQHQI